MWGSWGGDFGDAYWIFHRGIWTIGFILLWAEPSNNFLYFVQICAEYFPFLRITDLFNFAVEIDIESRELFNSLMFITLPFNSSIFLFFWYLINKLFFIWHCVEITKGLKDCQIWCLQAYQIHRMIIKIIILVAMLGEHNKQRSKSSQQHKKP